jgi:hypothetical protein
VPVLELIPLALTLLAGVGYSLVRGRTSVSVIRSSQCQCTGQVGIRYPRGLLAGPGVGTVAITQSERAWVAALREFAA